MMMQLLFDDVVETDYGQFDITWSDGLGFDGDWNRFFDGQVNGLVGAADPDGVYINLARRSGGSPMRIELHHDEPADDGSYQDVVEVSIVIPADADVRWSSWAGESSGGLLIPPGQYRLRVNARDRDGGADDEFAEGPVDWYLLQLWPAPPGHDVIVRSASNNAAYWHREIGGRS